MIWDYMVIERENWLEVRVKSFRSYSVSTVLLVIVSLILKEVLLVALGKIDVQNLREFDLGSIGSWTEKYKFLAFLVRARSSSLAFQKEREAQN